MRKYAVLIFSVAILSGIIVQQIVQLPFIYGLLSLVLALTFTFFTISEKNQKILFICTCICFGITLGLLRTVTFQKNIQQKNISEEKLVRITGTISDYPDERVQFTYLTITPKNDELEKNISHEKILVRTNAFPAYYYGDTVSIEGKRTEPEDTFDEDSLTRFSYKQFLYAQGIGYIIYNPKITLLTPGQGFVRSLYDFKDKLLIISREYIQEPEVGLFVGIMFGIKHALSNDILAQFTSSGLIHIVVLSGYNIALVLMVVGIFIKRLPKRIRFLILVTSVLLFILFVGPGVSLIRAALMALIVIFLRDGGFEGDAKTVLFLVAAMLALYNPSTLVYDPGFALSFLATYGLLSFAGPLERMLYFIPKTFSLREIIATTIATWIMVTPYLLWYMGTLSLYALFANSIVVPLVPFCMLIGAILLITGYVYVPLSFPFAALETLILGYMIQVSSFISSLPFAHINVSLTTTLFLVCYFLLAVASFSVRETKSSG